MRLLPYTQRNRLLLVLIILLANTKIFAQLSADFTVTPTSGCAPIVVQFTDQSTGNPTEWQWDLGNGVTSYLQNPSVSYFNPGIYRVKLIVRTATETDSVIKEQVVQVYPNPVIDFTANDTTGCFPLPIQFTDLSTTASGSLTNWSWDFGDGTSSQEINPVHIYNEGGNYSVTLRVTNSFGCITTFSKTKFVKTVNGVNADFTNNTPGLCKAPVSIQFTNKSTGPADLSYQWEFGDGLKSNEASPSHTYSASGSYTVKLIVSSSLGCVDTITKENLIAVGNVTSAFSSPDKICVNQIVPLTNVSNPAPGAVIWRFGDGTSSNSLTPQKRYSTPGTYTITLVNNFGGCFDSVSKKIEVTTNPKPAFSADQLNSCKIPFTVNFTNTTPGNNTYKWLFGDSTTSTDVQPQHTYTAMGSYTVTLISFNENGCSDTLVKQNAIKVQKPAITVTGFPKNGCLPLQVSPGVSVVTSDQVASYLWKFGDGATSTSKNPTHTYTDVGKFSVTLIVATINGCTDSVVIKDAVSTGEKPEANFTANPTLVCAKDPISFTDQSTSQGIINEWFWKFGDGQTSTQQNPVHQYQDTGIFSVALIININTCPDTVILKDIVRIKPPIAKFTVINDCNNKYVKGFTDQSLGALTWQWDLGDGTTTTEQSPSHTYAAPGKYTVKLDVTNGACTNSATQVVNVVDEKADFNIDPNPVCKGKAVNFAGQNFNAANIAKMEWDFGDGGKAAGVMSLPHNYIRSGKYVASLKITDLAGCTHTATKDVAIYGPTAGFFSDVPGTCLSNGSILFTDSSKTDGVNAIVKRVWVFGDSTTDSTTDNTYRHLYTKVGEYTVSLKVMDSFGCTDMITKSKIVTIADPKADFISLDSSSCTSKPVKFTNRSSGITPVFNWTFGDGGVSNQFEPVYIYKDTGLYTINLVITDKFGCKDSISKDNYVNITYPSASFSISDSLGSCPPLLVNFSNSSTNYSSIRWDFDDGNISTVVSPSHYYTQPGTYTATLKATSPGGCVETASKKIVVKGPMGTLVYPAQTGCNPHTVTLMAHTVNNRSFIWDYSDGNTLATLDSVVQHTYTQIGSYVPKMILIDETGCKVPIIGKDTIKVVDVDANFSFDNTELCDSGFVKFSDLSTSNESIASWNWLFGDGTTSNEQSPTHQFKTAGTFTTQLITTSLTGCKDTASSNQKIDVFESPKIDITGNLESCMPGKLLFKGKILRGDSSLLRWKWNFGNGGTDTIQHPIEQTYLKDGTYQLKASVTDSNNCKANITKTITIHPLPIVDAGPNLTLCRDDSVQLKATGASTYGWGIENPLSCYNCKSPKASPTDTTLYKVTGYTQFGCSGTDSVTVFVQQRFTINVSPDDSVCAGNTILLSAGGAETYTWTPASELDNPNIHNPKAKPQTSTTYTVIGQDKNKCFTDTASVFIKVNPYPVVNAGPDITMPVGSSVRIKPAGSPDVISWLWSPSESLSCATCDTTIARPKHNIKYTLAVKNSSGCVSFDDMNILLTCNNGNFFIPNTFSPNGDGNNDKFYPRGTGVNMIRSLRIYNRWGEQVFERMNFAPNDAQFGWDGTYKGQQLTSDVYIYTCEVICDNNEILTQTADVTLLR